MNTDDMPTMEQRWSVIEVALQKHRVDTSKIKPLERAVVITQAEADDVIGSDDEVWREFAEYLVERHPTWAGEGFHRLKNAEEILNNWHQPDFDDDSSAAELADNKYALIAWQNKNTLVYPAGNTIEDMLAVYCDCTFVMEYPESPDHYVDLDTGEAFSFFGKGAQKIKTVITLTLGDVEYINVFDS